MSPIFFKAMGVATATLLMSGCGLVQSVTDSTASTARSIFHKPIDTLHLDFSGRVSLNRDAAYMSALAVPTVVRIYQTSDDILIRQASYERLLRDDASTLGTDLLDARAVLVRPGEGAELNVPLKPGARFVTVVAFFRSPDQARDTWRLTLARDELEADRSRVIELSDAHLTLRPLPEA